MNIRTKRSPDEFFQENFTISLASFLETAQYGIRYRVYCEEMGYECQDRFPNGLEMDKFDSQSIHVVIGERKSRLPIGCVRIVCANNAKDLPIATLCHEVNDKAFPFCDQFLEVSRIAIIPEFRKRQGEDKFPIPIQNTSTSTKIDNEKREHPHILSVALYMSAIAVIMSENQDFAVALVNPILQRHLRQTGVSIVSIGDFIFHRGKRSPCIINISQTLDNFKKQNTEQLNFLKYIKHSLFG